MSWLVSAGLLGPALAPALPPACSPSAQTAEIVSGKLGARLDDYLSRCAVFGFSGSALVESGGEVVLLKGYGLAEREPRRPNTPDTIFDLGSLTKQFTATAILRLEQDGRLSTSDTLAKFFEDVPSDKDEIQVHHLLTHTSGLPRAIATVGSAMEDRAAMVAAVLGAPLQSKAGETFSYSNVGYDLLGAIVEIAAGASFEDYLREKLFGPAEMTSTGFRKDGRLPSSLAARGYKNTWQPDLPGSTIQGEREEPWDPSLATEGWYSWGLRGAGGVLSTVLDLRRWQHALDGESILEEDAKKKLFRPFRGDYACGWYVLKTERGSTWIEHGGSTDNGFDCKFTRFPEHQALLVVLGNVLGGSLPWVNLNLGKLVRGEEVAWPPPVGRPDGDGMRSLEGSWEAPGDARFQISVQDEKVVLEALNEKALRGMLPASSPRANALLKKTEEIAKDLAKNDFKTLHAAEDPKRPLFFFDNWWKRLEEQLGQRNKLTVIGVVSEPRRGDTSLIRVDYANGAELLKLSWRGETLVGTTIGSPYPSRRVLQPTAENTWTEFDLIGSKVLVEIRSPAGNAKKPGRLELAADGKSLTLTKRKAQR